MAQLLYIESSPRKDRSASIQIAETFTDEYLKTHTGDSVETLDLWNNEFPPFNGDTINAKSWIGMLFFINKEKTVHKINFKEKKLRNKNYGTSNQQ